MTLQHISKLNANSGGVIAWAIAASVITAGFFASPASAFSLVPQQEGEVNVGLGNCLGSGCSYLSLDPLLGSVDSLVDSSTGTRSRLFVDKFGTANTYGGVQFLSKDIGTADETGDYWFRPVAMKSNGVDPKLEQGQLEVGTFRFNFASTLDLLNVRWFDVEYLKGDRGTSYTIGFSNGTTSSGMLLAGLQSNIQSQSFNNVSWIELNLGEKYARTGDGVNVQLEGEPESVPEPGLVFGLGSMAVIGLLSRAKKSTQLA